MKIFIGFALGTVVTLLVYEVERFLTWNLKLNGEDISDNPRVEVKLKEI